MEGHIAGQPLSQRELDQQCINTIRFLSADAVEAANSGHPGTPMGTAVMAYVLWDRFLRHSPGNPLWWNRDRFVLSAGHASMLLYSMLHLTGYNLPLAELKNFRQLGSMTPGHPELHHTPGVETTTGPLGQGFGNAVGMAVAEAWLAANFNAPALPLVDHNTYVIASDGDLMEGVASEAASLAGFLRLGKLIVLYDDNSITIEGSTDLAFREDVGLRFQAYGWEVIGPIDGMDIDAVHNALTAALAEPDKPKLIICRTVIGVGSPKANTAEAHGAPLGADAVRAAKEHFGWPLEPLFHVPEAVTGHMQKALQHGQHREQQSEQILENYRREFPEQAGQFEDYIAGRLADHWSEGIETLFDGSDKPVATRNASGKVLNVLAQRLGNLLGGSADLAPSTKTLIDGEGDFGPLDHRSRNMHFGVREHAMGAIANGMALHGGVIPYTATFLQFADYMRPSIRLACLMGLRVIYVFTHDSIGLGEDGPTHQPIEHLAALRAIPNMTVVRPSDAHETAVAWRLAIEHCDGPTALVLSRQNLPVIERTGHGSATGLAQGGYILWESAGECELIIIASGSEVELALSAAKQLAESGRAVRVVSLPCWELFARQTQEYHDSVLPPQVTKRIAVEAASAFGWERWIGNGGRMIGMQGYGASAPSEDLYRHFGITAEGIVAAAQELLGS